MTAPACPLTAEELRALAVGGSGYHEAANKLCKAVAAKIERDLDRAQMESWGRSALDDRVSLYYVKREIESLMVQLGDALYDEAKAMEMGAAA